MILSILQSISNWRAERARNQEREEARRTQQGEREELMAMLRAEQQRSAELTARVMELSEIAINRANGRNASGDGENNRGE